MHNKFKMIKSLILALVIIAIGMSFDFKNFEFKLVNLAYFIDIPSLIFVVIPTLGLAIGNFSWKTYKKTWLIPFGNPENYEQSELIETHKCVNYMGNMFIIMGLIGSLIGVVLILQNLDDPKKIGPAVAITIMTLFYSVILKGFCMHRSSKIEQFIK